MKITILLVLPSTSRTGEPAVFQRVSHIADKPLPDSRRGDSLSLLTEVSKRPFRPDR